MLRLDGFNEHVMRVIATSRKTYLLLNGLSVRRPLRLATHSVLRPAALPPSSSFTRAKTPNALDLALTILCLRDVSSQIEIVGSTPKEAAELAWRSLWDVVLLSALAQCHVNCNLQSSVPVERLGPSSRLTAVNTHLVGLSCPATRVVPDEDALWLEESFSHARELLAHPRFEMAVQALASHHWIASPRIQLALLWSGIEGLFGVESEISFRLSLYVARFLAPQDSEECRHLFEEVRRSYSRRSAAVHGAPLSGNIDQYVTGSADLLHRLVRRCVTIRGLPDTATLAP